LGLIDDYQHDHPGEGAVVARLRAFVETHEDCFRRELRVGHVTGSAWLLNRSMERVLLTHHRKLDRWLQLGGHADGNPDVAAVALREAEEESGIAGIRLLLPGIFDVDIHEIPESGREPAHYHYDCRFLLQADVDEGYVVSEESNDLTWIALDDVARYTQDASIMRMLEKSRVRIREL